MRTTTGRAISRLFIIWAGLTFSMIWSPLFAQISGETDVCIGNTYTYTAPDVPPNNYTWIISGGLPASPTTNTNEVDVNWIYLGTGTVTAINNDSGDTAMIEVTVSGAPEPEIVDNSGSLCAIFGRIVRPPSDYEQVQSEVSELEKEQKDTIAEPIPIPGLPRTFCFAVCGTKTFTYSTPLNPGSTYTWNVSGATSVVPNNNEVTITWDSSGTGSIVLTETTAAGCNGTSTICIEILESPIAGFTTLPEAVNDTVNICLGQTINFFDQSIGANNWFWDFDDGNISSLQNPSHFYNGPGTYTVTLIIGTEVELQNIIKFPREELPRDELPVDNQYREERQPADLRNEDQIITPGQKASTCNCTDTFSIVVVVDDLPAPEILCPSIVCPGDTAVYSTDAVCNMYDWTIEGGTIVSGNNTPEITVVWGDGATGPGIITLDVGSCPGFCPTPTVEIVPIIPDMAVMLGEREVCLGATANYRVPKIPGTEYAWSIDPPTAGQIAPAASGSGLNEVIIAWLDTGTHTVTVNYNNTFIGCSGTAEAEVRVIPVFQMFSPGLLCENVVNATRPFTAFSSLGILANADWSVITPDGTLLPDILINSPLFNTYDWSAGPGIYTIIARPNPSAGDFCNDEVTLTETIIATPPPAANILGPDPVCPGSTHSYTAVASIASPVFNWTVTGGTPSATTGSSIDVTWDDNGPYEISVTQSLAAFPFCTSDAIGITVNPIPDVVAPAISGDDNVCLNNPGSYGFSDPIVDGATYTWAIAPDNLGSITTDNTNSIDVQWNNNDNMATTAEIILIVEQCNSDTSTFTVNLNPSPQPVIGFPDPVCQNAPVQFTGSDGDDWDWDFDDGGMSSDQNPEHTFTAPGTYNVMLTITNNTGCAASTTALVDVKPAPLGENIPEIGGDASVCVSDAANYSFSETLLPDAMYTWSIDPPDLGTITSPNGDSFINVQWNNNDNMADTAQIILEVTSLCGDTTVSYEVHINPKPKPVITFADTTCEGTTVSFMGSDGSSWLWDFGDSTATSNLQNPDHVYVDRGTYPVNLTVTNDAGCEASITRLIDIKPTPLALVSPNNQVVLCNDSVVDVTIVALNGAGYQFSWFPSGNTGSEENVTAEGSYFVEVTNALGCMSTSNTVNVFVDSCVTIPGGPPGTGGCAVAPGTSLDFDGTITTGLCSEMVFTPMVSSNGRAFRWEFGDGNSVEEESPTHTYTLPGVYIVTMLAKFENTASPGDSCVFFIRKSIEIPILADFYVEFNCDSGIIQTELYDLSNFITNNVIDSREWFFDGTSSSTDLNPTNFFTEGPHLVKLEISSSLTGASCAIEKVIDVPAPVFAGFSSADTVCSGTPVEFTDTTSGGVISWFWDFLGDGSATSTSQNPTYTFNGAGNFTVKLTVADSFGCSHDTFKTITVLPLPVGVITTLGSTSICDGETDTLFAPTGASYEWSNGEMTPSIIVDSSGVFTVTVTGFNGCTFTTAPVDVTVSPLPPADISGPQVYCTGEFLQLEAEAGDFNYQWLFDDLPVDEVYVPTGTNSRFLQPRLTDTTFTGKYIIVVTDPFTGCSDTSDPYMVTVHFVPDDPITVSGSTTLCQGETVTLTAPSGSSYDWSTGESTQSIVVSTAGTYFVLVTTPEGCVYKTDNVEVEVNENPKPVITGNQVYCANEQLRLQTDLGLTDYDWEFDNEPTGDGFISIFSGPIYTATATPALSGIYRVTATDPATGCRGTSDPITVIVNALPDRPIIFANQPFPLCEGNPITITIFNPDPNATYLWSNGNAGTSIVVSQEGSYFVTATSPEGCSATSNAVTIGPTPDMKCVLSGCYEKCEDEFPLTIPGPPGFISYEWLELDTNGNLSTVAVGAEFTATGPGTFFLVLTNLFGCTDTSDFLQISSIPLPDIEASSNRDTVCEGGTVTLTGEGGFNYQWFDLADDPICTPNGFGDDIGGLMNALAANGQLITLFNVDISGNPAYNIFLTNLLPLLPNPSGIIWRGFNTGTETQFFLFSQFDPSTIIQLSFDNSLLPPGFDFTLIANINRITPDASQLEPDGSTSHFVLEVTMNDLSVVNISGRAEDRDGFTALTTPITVGGCSFPEPIGTGSPFTETVTEDVTYVLCGEGPGGCVNYDTISVVVIQEDPIFANIDCCADTFLTVGDSIAIEVTFTGNGPWTFTYTDGTNEYEVTTGDNPYQLIVSPATTTTYELVDVVTRTCDGEVCGKATVGVNPDFTAGTHHGSSGSSGSHSSGSGSSGSHSSGSGSSDDHSGSHSGSGSGSNSSDDHHSGSSGSHSSSSGSSGSHSSSSSDDGPKCKDMCIQTQVISQVDEGDCRTVTLSLDCDPACFHGSSQSSSSHSGSSQSGSHSGSGSGSGSGSSGSGSSGSGSSDDHHSGSSGSHSSGSSGDEDEDFDYVDISIPCGNIDSVSNSLGLRMEIITSDMTTGITGIRVEIPKELKSCANGAGSGSSGSRSSGSHSGSGSGSGSGSSGSGSGSSGSHSSGSGSHSSGSDDVIPALPFTITYEVCFDTTACSDEICEPLVAYRCGPCVQYDEADDNPGGGASKREADQDPGFSEDQNGIANIRSYPNPFSGATNIVFSVPESEKVILNVYDLNGALVATLFEGDAKANVEYKMVFDAAKLPDGVYFYHFISSTRNYNDKLILVR